MRASSFLTNDHAGGRIIHFAPDLDEARFPEPPFVSRRRSLDIGRAPIDVFQTKERRNERAGPAVIENPPAEFPGCSCFADAGVGLIGPRLFAESN